MTTLWLILEASGWISILYSDIKVENYTLLDSSTYKIVDLLILENRSETVYQMLLEINLGLLMPRRIRLGQGAEGSARLELHLISGAPTWLSSPQ